MKSVIYNFYKEIDGTKIYRELLSDKYIIEIPENGRIVCIHFYFDYNGDLIIDNVYKNMRNYKTYRYIKKYAENKVLVNTMMKLKNNSSNGMRIDIMNSSELSKKICDCLSDGYDDEELRSDAETALYNELSQIKGDSFIRAAFLKLCERIEELESRAD